MILPRLTLVAPALLMLASVACAQTPVEAPLPIVGGYQKASVDDPDIKAAADFAISAAPKKVRLDKIVSARQQIVAGVNYSLCLSVKADKIGLLTGGKFVAAKVFRDLDKRYKLTSWQDVKTCN
ncbi:cystatin domain-containing protein [Asticcacaulis sp.]|uniref:cystatin domain-containing protein n=1 Tax=Asticcacaulis sp. TaxID=1872648 RepID=UPI002BADD5F5|nr:cystatin domain-containing protein [Asticcacaulis sp.]HTM81859.1 cystatin domain-containing protein [Asticcacaulis sp.]